jgi:parallel beta-helix repeat protein
MMRKALVLILFMLTTLSMIYVLPVDAQSYQTITINANGNITPSDAALKRDGHIYTITADFSLSIIVEANNVIIDGANHTLQGPSINENSIALNLTAANITVENIHITNWKVGVLGVWNNNTIANNEFTNNYEGIVIYGDDYVVRQNSISNSTTGLFIDGGFRPQGDNNLIIQNQIIGNNEAFDITNSNGTTITTNSIANNDVILVLGQTAGKTILYSNNFINNTQALDIPVDYPTWESFVPISPAGQWDNGTVGNYWSDYTARYPNASEIDHTGIGNTPYAIANTLSYSESFENGTDITKVAVLGTAIDNYPLMTPISTSTATLTTSSTASPSVPEFPSGIIIISLLVATCSVALVTLKYQAKSVYKPLTWY